MRFVCWATKATGYAEYVIVIFYDKMVTRTRLIFTFICTLPVFFFFFTIHSLPGRLVSFHNTSQEVWIRNQLDVTFVLSFISLLQVAQHVSGNHVPIFRSWRLRNVIATCLYCVVTMSGVIQMCLSVSGLWVVVSLLYVGVVQCVNRLNYIPVAAGMLSRQDTSK